MSFGARALIRLDALEHNLEVIRAAAPGSRVMAVIKANAYGHGMVTVAQQLANVDAFAVARVPEALELRENGIVSPVILLAGVMNAADTEAVAQYGFEPVVHCKEQVELLKAVSKGRINVWVKFDTGMNRLGFDPGEAQEVLGKLVSAPAVAGLRLMTHLSSADDLQCRATERQLRRFRPLISGFDGAVSIGNTPATFGWPAVADAQRE